MHELTQPIVWLCEKGWGKPDACDFIFEAHHIEWIKNFRKASQEKARTGQFEEEEASELDFPQMARVSRFLSRPQARLIESIMLMSRSPFIAMTYQGPGDLIQGQDHRIRGVEYAGPTAHARNASTTTMRSQKVERLASGTNGIRPESSSMGTGAQTTRDS